MGVLFHVREMRPLCIRLGGWSPVCRSGCTALEVPRRSGTCGHSVSEAPVGTNNGRKRRLPQTEIVWSPCDS